SPSLCHCDCGCPPDEIVSAAPGQGGNTPDQSTLKPIRYADGTIKLVSHDLVSNLGAQWGQTRSWSNGAGYDIKQNNGAGWVDSQNPRLLRINESTLALVLNGTTSLYFDK